MIQSSVAYCVIRRLTRRQIESALIDSRIVFYDDATTEGLRDLLRDAVHEGDGHALQTLTTMEERT